MVRTTLLLLACSVLASAGDPAKLQTFFQRWRAFQKPRLIAGVPDYSPAAMARQHRELLDMQQAFQALEPKGGSIREQVDGHILRAEMAGLDFDHRVLRPWANNPAFYVTVFWERSDQPAREGPFAVGAVELWQLAFPLKAADAAALEAQLASIPGLLKQAESNLVGNGRDLWVYGARALRAQADDLGKLVARLTAPGAPAQPSLVAAARRAQAATTGLAAWVEAKLPHKTGPSAIGIANYDWYLTHVQLLPHTWRDEVTLLERELARAQTLLALEEHRNAKLPQPVPVASAEEHGRCFPEAVHRYMAFLKDHDLMTVAPYLEPALLAEVGTFQPGPREFFTEVDYRDPRVMRTHGYHWFDLAREEREPHADPIRRGGLLYNIFNTRTEGNATGWEELMLQAGMFDDRPRSRELIYILLAQRAARGLASLRLISGEFTIEQAAAFASAHTPRGWLSLQGQLVRAEQHLYLQQPGYGTCYITGKLQLDQLLARRREQLGEAFSFKAHTDAINAAGLIPASLLRWELTGELPEDVARMLATP
ncbi:MAG TPA: DUF885 family protein [Holophagaceae bacterium]|nr:DUF885 family protein [Holophagaceae bacterium]